MAKRGRAGVKRVNSRKFTSGTVQGPSSYVSFFKPTWDEMKQATANLRENARDVIGQRCGVQRVQQGSTTTDVLRVEDPE